MQRREDEPYQNINNSSMGIPNKDECHVFIRTLQGSIVKTLIDCLKDIVFEQCFTISPECIKSTTMDASKMSLVYLKLDAKSFEEYMCTKPSTIGISMQAFHKLLKSLTSNDVLTLFIEKSNEHELGIAIENVEKKSCTVFRLKLLDMNYSEYSIPSVEFDRVVRVPSTAFQRLCRDMSHLSPFVRIRSYPESLELFCKGDFASQETTLGGATDINITENSSNAIIESMYSLKYLTLFGRASNLGTTMSLFIKKEHPLILEYEAGSLGMLKFLLTPSEE